MTKLSVIGCDFLKDDEQLAGRRDPDWRPLIQPIGGDLWPAIGTIRQWSELDEGARQQGRMDVFEKARHVRAHLDSSCLALNLLSEAYSRHLFATCEAGAFKPDVFVGGRFSAHIEFLAHALLSELSSLRDHLAWFAAQIVLGVKADSLGTLRSSDKFKRSDHPLPKFMRDAWGTVEVPGWLRTFTDYRNLLVHNIPLTEIASAVGVFHYLNETPHLGSLPQVSLRLPSNPSELRDAVRAGPINASFEAWISHLQDGARAGGPDVLKYGHQTLTKMFELARMILKFSPVIGKPLVISAAEIVSIEWHSPTPRK